MKKKLDALTIAQIIRFIRSRHCGYIEEATHYQKILKKKLGKHFIPVLMKHGDPDKKLNDGDHNYWTVINKWFAEENFCLPTRRSQEVA